MIDTFHRIRLLNESGVGVHLHCFSYGRDHSPELEALCRSVTYYRRKKGFLYQLSSVPFIASTRMSKDMVKNLCKNDHPILFDGIHTTGILADPSLASRKKLVRVHNIEHLYYLTLAGIEIDPLKKIYYLIESARLNRYEKILTFADHLLSVSESDNDYFNQKYHNSVLIPSSHPFDKTEILEGSGEYVIYHGDLSVNENSATAISLCSNVFPYTGCKCIIAGKNPSDQLKNAAGKYANVLVVSNPTVPEMNKLIMDAHINLLPVQKMNGLKLKLLYALFAGRHLIINSEMAKGLRPAPHYHIADNSTEMIREIRELIKQPFTVEMIKEREEFVLLNFNNKEIINKLIELI